MAERMGMTGLALLLVLLPACLSEKKNCALNEDCQNGAFCGPAGCTWGCFEEGVGCREGGWCHPVSGKCFKELPALSDLKATPSAIAPGGSSTLEWTVLGADTLMIEPGSVDVTGTSSILVNPDVTTVYTLTATNTFGTVSATAKVDVAILQCDEESDCTAAKLTCNKEWGLCVVEDCAGRADFTPCNLVPTDGSLNLSYDICVKGVCVSPGTCTDGSCNVPGPHFPLADTGQRTCYSNSSGTWKPEDCSSLSSGLDGQDAQYGWDASHADNRERFTWDGTTSPAEPIVVDRVTGLTWQDGYVVDKTWAEALTYCDALDWLGHKWRLPDPYELDSIVDAGKNTPAIDWSFFMSFTINPPEGSFWTSSVYVPDTTREWYYVDLGGYGHVGFDVAEKNNVLCVWSEPTSIPTQRFNRIQTDQPIVEDMATKLIWQGCIAGLKGSLCGETDPGAAADYNWVAALSHCNGLNWGGYPNGWRLPNRKELMSIVDHRLAEENVAKIDGTAFPETSVAWFWSSTPYVRWTDYAWLVNFGQTFDNYPYSVAEGPKGNRYRVRCVHDGP